MHLKLEPFKRKSKSIKVVQNNWFPHQAHLQTLHTELERMQQRHKWAKTMKLFNERTPQPEKEWIVTWDICIHTDPHTKCEFKNLPKPFRRTGFPCWGHVVMSHLVSVSHQSDVIIFLLTSSNKPPDHHQTPKLEPQRWMQEQI